MVPHFVADIVEVYFWPSSTNLDINMRKVSIGWSSSTDLHANLYRLFACRANALCRKQISTAEKDYRVLCCLNSYIEKGMC